MGKGFLGKTEVRICIILVVVAGALIYMRVNDTGVFASDAYRVKLVKYGVNEPYDVENPAPDDKGASKEPVNVNELVESFIHPGSSGDFVWFTFAIKSGSMKFKVGNCSAGFLVHIYQRYL